MTAETESVLIENFAVFEDTLLLSGRASGSGAIASISLHIPGKSPKAVLLGSLSSIGNQGQFYEVIRFDPLLQDVLDSTLLVQFQDQSVQTISHLGFPRGQAAHGMVAQFQAMLATRAPGHVLEIGSRARSGWTRRDFVPDGWGYTGMDVLDGTNVDVVGDAHELSSLFPAQRFDAVMSFSVFEHLLMPWKVAIELNRVLNLGAIGLVTTHQAWPLHEAPWDFWRFSDQAWRGLFNSMTGFEIIEAHMGEPAYIVPQRTHAVTAWGNGFTAYLASNVLFRKVGDTNLRWDVSTADAVNTSYPAGEYGTGAKA